MPGGSYCHKAKINYNKRKVTDMKKQYAIALKDIKTGARVFYIRANTDNIKPFSVHLAMHGQLSDYYATLGKCAISLKKIANACPDKYEIEYNTIDYVPTSGSNLKWYRHFFINKNYSLF